MTNFKVVALILLSVFQVQSAFAFFYQRAPTYVGKKIVNSTHSVTLLKDFVDDPKEYEYQNYLVHVYFNESQPGVPQKYPENIFTGCMFDYVDRYAQKAAKGTYFLKRDWTMPAQARAGVWYREIYFGWSRNIRILCAGPKNRLTTENINRLMKGYVRIN